MEYETYQKKVRKKIMVIPRDEIKTEIIEAWPIHINPSNQMLAVILKTC
jgi:hypothetical protein